MIREPSIYSSPAEKEILTDFSTERLKEWETTSRQSARALQPQRALRPQTAGQPREDERLALAPQPRRVVFAPATGFELPAGANRCLLGPSAAWEHDRLRQQRKGKASESRPPDATFETTKDARGTRRPFGAIQPRRCHTAWCCCSRSGGNQGPSHSPRR